MTISGILFDAGGVLIRPVGDRWNPRYDFEDIVRRHCPEVDETRFPAAIENGQRFLDEETGTPGRTAYHRVMLSVLGVEFPTGELLAELEAPAAGPVVELYPDVRPVLDELTRRGIRMSVVSDNWAGLPRLFDELGIGHCFAGYAISEVLGCNKPDPRMYAEGSRLIDRAPAECLFVDDDPDLVEAARELGYQAVTLDRAGETGVLRSLGELLNL